MHSLAVIRRQHLILTLLVAGAVICLVTNPETWYRGLLAVVDAPWFPLMLVGVFLIRPFLAVPLSPLSILIGWQYGLLGIPFVLLGTVITCLPPFLIARHLDESLLGLRFLQRQVVISILGPLRAGGWLSPVFRRRQQTRSPTAPALPRSRFVPLLPGRCLVSFHGRLPTCCLATL